MATGGKKEVTPLITPVKVMKFDKYLKGKKRQAFEQQLKLNNAILEVSRLDFREYVEWDDVSWYHDATPSQKLQLRDFLIELDRQNRVDPQNNRTKIIHKGVHQIMTALTEEIAQHQPKLGGKLFHVGSSHNGTKVGEPDEFDFIYELNARTLFDDKNASTFAEICDGSLEIKVCLPDLSDKKHLVDFLELYDTKLTDEFPVTSSFKYLVRETKEESNQLTFNSKHIAFVFFMVLNEALQQLDLPEGWSHGGFDRPRFSGVRLRYPSFLIQLYYDGTETCTHEPLSVSVDFVPVLKVDHHSERTLREVGVLERYLLHMDEADWVHLAYDDTDPPLTWYEEQLLSHFHFDSVAKTVIRVFKVLCKEALCSVPHYVSKHSSVRRFLSKQNPKYADNRTLDPSDWALEYEDKEDEADLPEFDMIKTENQRRSVPCDYFDDTLVTGQDIGENLGNEDIVSSYVIKLSVMTLIALDPKKGTSWTSDNMVDIVLSMCLIFKRVFSESNLYDVGSPPKELKVSVPLKRYYKTPHNTETESPSTFCSGSPNCNACSRDFADFGNCVSPVKRCYITTKERYYATPGYAETFCSDSPNFYNAFSRALARRDCWKLQSMLAYKKKGDRMDGILEILQSACSGKSTAKFKIHCEYPKDTKNRYVKKVDLKPLKWKLLKCVLHLVAIWFFALSGEIIYRYW